MPVFYESLSVINQQNDDIHRNYDPYAPPRTNIVVPLNIIQTVRNDRRPLNLVIHFPKVAVLAWRNQDLDHLEARTEVGELGYFWEVPDPVSLQF